MIFIIAALFYFIGYEVLVTILRRSPENRWFALSLAPVFSYFCFYLLIFVFVLFGQKISPFTFQIFLGSLAFIFLGLNRNQIKTDILDFKSSFLKEKQSRVLLLFLVLTFLGLGVSALSKEIWPGDGMGIWASRALEWYHHQGFQFTEFTLGRLDYWLGYPIFHSLNMWIVGAIVPGPFSISCNSFDFIPFLSMAFLAIGLFRELKFNFKHSIILGLFLGFAPRAVLNMIGSGYADPLQGWMIASIYTFLIVWMIRPSNELKLYLGGATFYCPMVKNEGFFRAIFFYVSSFSFTKSLKKTLKFTWPYLLIAALSLILVKVFNPAPKNFVPYLNEMNLEKAIKRIPLIIEAIGITFFDLKHGVKAFWLPNLLLFVLIPFTPLFKKSFRSLYIYTCCVFAINFAFNIAPLILTSLEGDVFNNPQSIAMGIFSRLFYQTSYPLSFINLYFMFKLSKYSSYQSKDCLSAKSFKSLHET
ncbi:MAG: hypothetical protein ACPGJV_01755 [Bacteriovoracaceae bacterium]